MESYKLPFVDLEQAKYLKTLGFPQDYDSFETYTNLDGGIWVKPQLDLVIRWFEEEKSVFIFPIPEFDNDTGLFKSYTIRIITNIDYIPGAFFTRGYKTRDEALSTGIDKAIEILIENGKQ